MSAFGSHNYEASTSSNFLLGTFSSQHNSSKYRAYASAVDKALKSFESTTEWADLIAALGKLGKVFASNSKSFNDIPNPLTVAKRLSQCLHPALPSGVHLKALETYRQVFNILGHSAGHNNQNLARSLFLYAIGLFPLIDHCGIKVKSELLSIFEQYLLPLGTDLRPALPGFIAAALLALEEGTEFYGRAFQLLDKLLDKVGPNAFYTCFWQAVGGSSSVRLPALSFVNAKLEKRKSAQPAAELLRTLAGGATIDECHQQQQHMLRALCAVADDAGSSSALAQRHLLDFLCTAIPLDSAWVPRGELIQLLRRCMFIVLRRDMSLNRRLYQWLLNRSNDVAFVGLPVNGTEDSMDLVFFKQYTLPLIKMAIRDYLQCADTVEVPPLSTGTIRRYGTLLKDPQIQFPEVRVCRLLHYMLDRPELGQMVLDETLADLLETICGRDVQLVRDLQSECAALEPNFERIWTTHQNTMTMDEEQTNRRADEIKKNFNVLLNSLDPGFLWNFFKKFFASSLQQQQTLTDDGKENDDHNNSSNDGGYAGNNATVSPAAAPSLLFPLMVAYCVRNVQLDSHGDIRARHLPELVHTVLSGMASMVQQQQRRCVQRRSAGGSSSDKDNNNSSDVSSTECCSYMLAANIVLCRRLLAEITQNNLSMVFEQIYDDCESSPSKKGIKCNAELAEEQKLVERCLAACLRLLTVVCDWYCAERERRLVGVLSALFALMRDFADFPFYSLQLHNHHAAAANNCSSTQHHNQSINAAAANSTCRSLTDSLHDDADDQHQQQPQQVPAWLCAVLRLIDPPTWARCAVSFDFVLRNQLFDLLLYLCVRSASMIEQHAAVFGRALSQRYASTANGQQAQPPKQKTTTTVLLKPFLSVADLQRIEQEGLCRKAAAVLWRRFADDDFDAQATAAATTTDGDVVVDTLQPIAMLLLRLHSRRVSETSSEVEDIVVAELTSANKVLCGGAVRKFRDLWVFCRSAVIEEVYAGILLKPMNRAVMVLLSFIADEQLCAAEQVELRALAFAWFLDCAHHNELHKIVQMLTLMLLNPVTARVSIQFVQMQKRVTRDQLASMPAEANCVALTTVSGKQTFHHVCTDVEQQQQRRHLGGATAGGEQWHSKNNNRNSWNNYSYVDCDPRMAWVSDLNKQLLLPYGGSTNSNNNSSVNSDFSFANAFCGGFSTPVNQQQQQPQQIVGQASDGWTTSMMMNSVGSDVVNCSTNASSQQQHNPSASSSMSVVLGSGGGATTSGGTKGHRRTMSDIPQFDDDAESVDAYSMDTSMLDSDVVETVQFLVDSVCEMDGEDRETKQCIMEGDEDTDELEELATNMLDQALMDESESSATMTAPFVTPPPRQSSRGECRSVGDTAGGVFNRSAKSAAEKRKRCASAARERESAYDQTSIVGSLLGPGDAAAAVPRITSYAGGETIRRVRTGHRRQDSLQESIFSTGTQELRLFDPTELPNSTCPGDHKQPLLDETFSHMLFYAESPSVVDLGRAEKLFRTVGTLLRSGCGLGRHLVNSMLFTNMSELVNRTGSSQIGTSTVNAVSNNNSLATIGGASTAATQQLLDFMARHYQHIQGEGFWYTAGSPESGDVEHGTASASGGTTAAATSSESKTAIAGQQRHSTLFEIFTTVVLYFFRSYYLNSPINHVSEADLVLSWKCKIAALDCFTELLYILDDIVKEASSKELATFVQQIYRQTKTQKVILTLMLAAIPTPPNQKGWRMPLSMDIAEFNNGPPGSKHFRDLIFAYHRSLLSLATALVVLEHGLLGTRHFTSQAPFGLPLNRHGSPTAQITENQINYNSSQNRSTIREARYSVVELRLFLGVILNALKRCPARHELWLHFLVGILPYLDRALATFVVHTVEQICRNLYESVFINGSTGGPVAGLSGAAAALLNNNSSNSVLHRQQSVSALDHPKNRIIQFVDYRVSKTANDAAAQMGGDECAVMSPVIIYPANYVLMLLESLMSIMHFCLLDVRHISMFSESPFLASTKHFVVSALAAHPSSATPNFQRQQSATSATTGATPLRSSFSAASSSGAPTGGGGGGGGTFSSSHMTSMVGNAISVIPGTGLINNLFGRVFTSGENPSQISTRADASGKSAEMLEAQRELIKRFPSALAILIDVWALFTAQQQRGASGSRGIGTATNGPKVGTLKSLNTLILDLLNPIAKRHKNGLMNALGVVWMFRNNAHGGGGTKMSDVCRCSFVYSAQQIEVANLALNLKALSLTSIICSVSDTLKESANKTTKSSSSSSASTSDKLGASGGGCSFEVALLELLHQCTRQVTVTELRESWAALAILFNDSPLAQLPARASFLEFAMLTDFVRRCGSQSIIEDKQISKTILDVCQKLTDAINAIVGWQLESTTWLKRTLVVRQDASNSQRTATASSDLSPVLEQRGGGSIVGGASSVSGTTAAPFSSASAFASEANSMRGSTISLTGGGSSAAAAIGPSSRFSAPLDSQSMTTTISCGGGGGTTTGSNAGGAGRALPATTTTGGTASSATASMLRSSMKDSSSSSGGGGASAANKKDPSDSTQALFLLAENLAELIDSVCKSEDKEKLLPALQAVWNNTLPYLKAKSAKNVRFFLASSQFLASMSSYNYMRSVWKKNAMDLLWDNSFFKMDIHALRQWLVVIDNLMTNDKTSFKELLARITTSTSTTLSTLITSKEQEYEMRAQYLKRLALVILSSELDQYAGQLNEIQERLTENLRICQVPVIHTQVFTCYRVLLVRMSPSSFVSIWPSMVTELVHVLAQIDHQLSAGSAAAGGGGSVVDEQKSTRDEQCMQLFLAACKLLETLCTLPSGYMSQFQMCRWTFISPMNVLSGSDVFVPYAVRLNHLLNNRYTELTGADIEMRSASLFSIKTLTSYQELHPFFHALTMLNGGGAGGRPPSSLSLSSPQHRKHHHRLYDNNEQQQQQRHHLCNGGQTLDEDNVGDDDDDSASAAAVVDTDGEEEESEQYITGNNNSRGSNSYLHRKKHALAPSRLRDAKWLNGSHSLKSAVARIEHSLYVDFAEHWQL